MAVTLTVGTNTYATQASADAYFAQRLYASVWDGADADTKARALITATRHIDTLTLKHARLFESQALAFPRRITEVLPDVAWLSTYDQTAVPREVIDATYEEVYALLRYGDSERSRLQAQGVSAVTLGKLSETYDGRSRGLLSPDALALMTPLIAVGVKMRGWR